MNVSCFRVDSSVFTILRHGSGHYKSLPMIVDFRVQIVICYDTRELFCSNFLLKRLPRGLAHSPCELRALGVHVYLDNTFNNDTRQVHEPFRQQRAKPAPTRRAAGTGTTIRPNRSKAQR